MLLLPSCLFPYNSEDEAEVVQEFVNKESSSAPETSFLSFFVVSDVCLTL